MARLLEARRQDTAARAAWRSRMEMRRQIHRNNLGRIAHNNDLGSE